MGAATTYLSQKITQSNVNGMLTEMVTTMLSNVMFNPDMIEGFGQNNIDTYRKRFSSAVKKAGLSASAAKMVIQLTMQMKNYNRIISGKTTLNQPAKADPIIKEVFMFIENYCCVTTKNAGDKMPTVKIPESFPDICSLIYFISLMVLFKGSPPSTIDYYVTEMLKKPWAASLALDSSCQIINRTAVEKMWNSWSKSSGTKNNSLGEVLAFKPDIYSNQETDSIALMNADGSKFPIPTNGYSKLDIITWAHGVMVATSQSSIVIAG
jgi:hypothetical protein